MCCLPELRLRWLGDTLTNRGSPRIMGRLWVGMFPTEMADLPAELTDLSTKLVGSWFYIGRDPTGIL
jgi:hypothetical protein